uniref:Uncharacterized protein n=1 Tax=Triticum urartu TaxID=4572 RepID=A0A8R7QW66_TRIUA
MSTVSPGRAGRHLRPRLPLALAPRRWGRHGGSRRRRRRHCGCKLDSIISEASSVRINSDIRRERESWCGEWSFLRSGGMAGDAAEVATGPGAGAGSCADASAVHRQLRSSMQTSHHSLMILVACGDVPLH